jgi:hypothetical protein
LLARSESSRTKPKAAVHNAAICVWTVADSTWCSRARVRQRCADCLLPTNAAVALSKSGA